MDADLLTVICSHSTLIDFIQLLGMENVKAIEGLKGVNRVRPERDASTGDEVCEGMKGVKGVRRKRDASAGDEECEGDEPCAPGERCFDGG